MSKRAQCCFVFHTCQLVWAPFLTPRQRHRALAGGLSNPPHTSVQYNARPADRGGAIELSILSKHYGREISAWNIESATGLVFGEEAGAWTLGFSGLGRR